MSAKMAFGYISRDILRALAIGACVFVILSSPTGTRRLLKGIRKEWHKKKAQRALEGLRKRSLVDYKVQRNGTILVTATKEGKQKVAEWDIENLVLEKPQKWDGRWHIVISDIAEGRKRAREAFREKIYELGFYKLQKSVYVYPYPCQAEIELICSIYQIPDYEVLHIIAEQIPLEDKLRKHFKLAIH